MINALVLLFGCCRGKYLYLLNVWRPIVHALFNDNIQDCAGVFVLIGSTNVLHFSLIGLKIDDLLGVKILDIPYQLSAAYLSLIRPSLIGIKLVPDERSGPMTHWDQVPKNFYRPFRELWPLKFHIC